jgi:hypothetical protein
VCFLWSRGCVGSSSWLPDRVGQTNVVDEWTGSPLAVSRVPSSPGDEEADAISMLSMISGMGFK